MYYLGQKLLNKRIKLFGVYSEENMILKNEWFLKTLKDDFEIHLKFLGKIAEGDINCKEPSWYIALREKIRFIYQAVQDNIGDVIVTSDVDIQFFRKSFPMIKKFIRNNDIIFQSEYWPSDGHVNTGFMAIKCNEKTLQLWKYISEMKIEELELGDQSAVNHVLQNKLVNLKWDVFPRSVWAYSQGDAPPIDIILHHANDVEPKDCQSTLEAKIEQLKNLKEHILSKERFTRWVPFWILEKISFICVSWKNALKKPYSLPWIMKKIHLCIKERRLPEIATETMKKILKLAAKRT